MLLLCHYHRYLSKLPRLPVRVSVSPLLVPVVLSGILPRHPILQSALYFSLLVLYMLSPCSYLVAGPTYVAFACTDRGLGEEEQRVHRKREHTLDVATA